MKKITKLTAEQEAQIPEYLEKWIRVASKPLDREKSVKVTKELFGEDKTVLIAESIQNAVDVIKFIVGDKKLEHSPQLYSQLYSQLGSQLGSQLRSQLRSQLGSQLDSQLRSQLYSQLDSQLYSQLDSQLGSQLGSQLYSQLDSQLDSQLGDKVSYSYYTTQYWLSWLGYYDYAQFIGIEFDTEKLSKMEEILMAIPSIITLGKILVVIENPVCRWENGMLHSDQRPAIEWKDETGVYLLDGVAFEKELWERVVSREMSLSEIMKIEISDQRTVALKYNPQAIIKENAKLIDKDDRNNELYLVEGSEINKLTEFPKMYFLKMLCPTGRTFIEGVPPEEAEKYPSAAAMQAFLCNLTLEEYMGMSMES